MDDRLTDDAEAKPRPAPPSREQREAQALRDNLRRRKEQARARDDAATLTPPDAPDPD